MLDKAEIGDSWLVVGNGSMISTFFPQSGNGHVFGRSAEAFSQCISCERCGHSWG